MAEKPKRTGRATPEETLKTLLDNPETQLLLDKLADETIQRQKGMREQVHEERHRRHERNRRKDGPKRIGCAA